MPHIRVLSEEVVQKIAAGEVIERPASVIKELVENAIDAGSTHISVEIRDGGISYMRVTDNGCGIAREDVRVAFSRHATSKLETTAGLFHITQMGFRGEALYSIAAVSRLEMLTKQPDDPMGTRAVLEGGNVLSVDDRGCPDGTTVIVRDLFYNTPARLKFLSKPAAEASAVASMLARLILSRPDISVKYISGGRTVYHSTGDGDLRSAIYAIYGRDAANGLIQARQSWGDMSVSGYIGNPSNVRSTRTLQLLCVNSRPIHQLALCRSAEEAYGGITGAGKYPIFVLNIQLPPDEVDVNVHPNKLTVRFADEKRIRELIYTAVSKALGRQLDTPASILPVQEPVKKDEIRRPIYSQPQPRKAEEPSVEQLPLSFTHPIPEKKTAPLPVAENSVADFVNRVKSAMEPIGSEESLLRQRVEAAAPRVLRQEIPVTPQDNIAKEKTATEETKAAEPIIPVPEPAKPVIESTEENTERTAIYAGRVFDTYIILYDDNAMYIVDQHAAHERLLYERYVKSLREAQMVVQPMLIPQGIDVTYEEQQLIEDNMELFTSIGFELESYGRLSYVIRAVPMLLGEVSVVSLLRELVENLAAGKPTDSVELKKERLMSMACRAAVKGGDKLSDADVSSLLELIIKEKTPLSCPHGRPIVLVMEKNAIEKHFKRIK